ncbi:hypothetical protein [Streptomyces sp. NPDC020489]|uniref:hypothetical protein n=1 Tax=Streptomyces sp. NPDC020489 TaxID=3365077 RepID=UPI0037B734EB
MKQSGTSALLQGAVQDLASSVVSALRGGGHAPSAAAAAGASLGDDLTFAAARVLGADLLLPGILRRTTPPQEHLAVIRRTLALFPPRPQAAPTVQWSHWAMRRSLRLAGDAPTTTGSWATGPEEPEPDTAWIDGVPWPQLTHQLAVLAPLALPGEGCAVARVARARPLDVSRGFVRAVRRRDWQQAAGAGRWLATLDDVPHTLGLDKGLDFVELMSDGDPRVLLQVQAARLMRAGAYA